MEGIEERLRLVSMTTAALIHHLVSEARLFSARNRVRRMAVLTRGEIFVRFGIIRPVDTGPELFFNSVVTNSASARDILRIDQSAWIFRR